MSDLDRLIHAALDGTIAEADARELDRLVRGDAAVCRRYAEFASLHAAIPEALAAGPVAVVAEKSHGRRPGWPVAVGALAALLLIAVAWWQWPTVPKPVATLIETKSCRWESATLPTAAGSQLEPGRFRLADGIARIVFASGAEITIEGPADLELVSPMACVLRSGQLAAKMPPSAHGFVVETPSSVLTDLGTEFGVKVHPGQISDVQVFSGSVDGVHRGTGQLTSMRTGSGIRFAADRVTPLNLPETHRDVDPAKAKPSPRTRTVHLSTAMGRGKDAFVMAMETIPDDRTTDTLLLIKKNKEAMFRWDRMAYLGFDLSLLPARPILEAELTVTFAPTGMGYASLVPDATFHVYAVTDAALDGWDEKQIDWASAPANVPAEGLIPTKVALVGSFVVPQGVQSGSPTIAGTALVEFLNRHPNSMATFVMTRETIGRDGMDLVHGIASRRHPTLNPPTLRLTVAERR
jgi:ferric-dicitrate binding protein FerR (iron transport regulator)